MLSLRRRIIALGWKRIVIYLYLLAILHLIVVSVIGYQINMLSVSKKYLISLDSHDTANKGPRSYNNDSLIQDRKYKLRGELEVLFNPNFNNMDRHLLDWKSDAKGYCRDKFWGYSHRFIRIHDIILDPSRVTGPVGDEELLHTLKQKESSEFLKMKPGLFVVPCKHVPKYTVAKYLSASRGHIPTYLRNTVARRKSNVTVKAKMDAFTVVVTRYDYANMFHAINDVFNVFLLHVLFHKNPRDTTIIIADGHPHGHIDPLWQQLFGNVTRLRQITQPVLFTDMVWNMYEKFCPLNDHSLDYIPHLADFRKFVLGSYNIQGKQYAECSDRMKVLFVWRRNYLAHPRNPSGKIDRKIKNEKEILNHLQNAYPDFDIEDVDLAALSFTEQLDTVANVDIVIGMHGAGLSHLLFAPDKGGILELWPLHNPVKSKKPRLVFRYVAKWKNFTFVTWQNKNKRYNLRDGFTYVPPGTIKSLFRQVLHKMCG